LSERYDLSWLPQVGEMVAENLLGKPATVNWGIRDARYGREMKGQVYFDHGMAVIDLAYELERDPDLAYHVLLHEIGHAKAHPQGLPDFAKTPKATIERQTKLETTHPTVHRERESQAEAWAKRWEGWADRRCPDGDLADKLLALTQWTPRSVSRKDPRGKLALAFDEWDESYHDLTKRRKVYKACETLLDVDKPIVAGSDLALYERTMRLMGERP